MHDLPPTGGSEQFAFSPSGDELAYTAVVIPDSSIGTSLCTCETYVRAAHLYLCLLCSLVDQQQHLHSQDLGVFVFISASALFSCLYCVCSPHSRSFCRLLKVVDGKDKLEQGVRLGTTDCFSH